MQVHAATATGRPPRVLVVGAGVGGLAAAALLARQGLEVQVLERAAQPGGKLRQVDIGSPAEAGPPAGTSPFTPGAAGRHPPGAMDAGPTVLTMRWVFDELFDALGLDFAARVGLRRCEVLARHAWGPDRLDLMADLEDSVARIEALCGADEAARYRRFCQRAQAVYQTLERPFLRSPRPNPLSLAWRVGLHRLPALWGIAPFHTLWQELGRHFRDPRLHQLFARYATYCGSSPFEAPATLMLVAHVEREAVWQLDGGMQSLARALADAARAQGVRLRCGQHVEQIVLRGGRACGLRLASGERLQADALLFNGDVAALQQGLLGEPLRQALRPPWRTAASPAGRPAPRSLSALTWHLSARSSGFALSHHNVFFSGPAGQAYRREFDDLAAGRLPADPTVYVCAQDRLALRRERTGPDTAERLMCLVNAPAQTDAAGRPRPLNEQEIDACEQAMWQQLRRAGLRLTRQGATVRRTGPADFAQMFPGSGGALYGQSTRGWQASFSRPAQTTRVPGLYLAGGTVHPGPGVPMAALSGQLAAQQILADLASTRRWHPVAMPGGMPTR